jgi:hypothetical protein
MSRDDLRHRAAAAREIPLETVLRIRGAMRDRHDRSKWHTEQGTLSIDGQKFMNWETNQGRGGAIDLVMHLAQVDFLAALAWLEIYVGIGSVAHAHAARLQHRLRSVAAVSPEHARLRLPARDPGTQDRVLQYLTGRRHLASSLLRPLVESHKLYSDERGNAVFVMVSGQANHPVGAELRGTGARAWRGMAPGSRKDTGYFWIGTRGSRHIVLCESAIDAISHFQMHGDRVCISTSGIRCNPKWLPALIDRGYTISCGFDADAAGDAMASQMISLHPTIQRLRPPAHDWNDALTSHS